MLHQDPDIRWRQRLENLTRAKKGLDGIVSQSVSEMSYVELAGWIHIFDLVFELSWKTLRDYMVAQWEDESFDCVQDVFRRGLDGGLIEELDVWDEMLKIRTDTSEWFNDAIAQGMIRKIQNIYLSHITAFCEKLNGKI